MTENNNKNIQIQPVSEDEGKLLDVMLRKAELLLKSGLMPKELNTKEKILVVLLKAKELGMPPLEAISQLYVVNQKVAMQATGMLAQIYRSGKAAYVRFGGDATSAWCEMARKDGVAAFKYVFTMEDAKRAGLLSKDGWRNYPKEMLLCRAITGCARKVFPDVIGGLYTPEELGLDVPPDVPIEAGVLESTSVETTEAQPTETSAVTTEEEIVVFEPEEKKEVQEQQKQVEAKVEKVEAKEEEKKVKAEKKKKEDVEKPEVRVKPGERLKVILGIVEAISSDIVEQQNFVKKLKQKLGITKKVAEMTDDEFTSFVEKLKEEVDKVKGSGEAAAEI